MLGLLGLGICIASISCLCCLCTSTLVYLPHLIDIKTGKFRSEKQKNEERKRLAKQIELQSGCSVGCCGIQSGECPCNIRYVLNPVLVKKTIFPSEPCNRIQQKKFCICPSFLDLVDTNNDNV
ncbi:uncharacterized protein LOC112493721 [Cephus cinctus]|uniref:Uncharacterized protein LOC112493721 n=1 Tax=Cephus cinctus TaxID=211228 RepID=A0AAJ7R9C5_CEPCN|nr:uncharacterized protein LOC112493721 [Cephus cinctus]